MADHPSDPFAPADLGDAAQDLELEARPQPAVQPAATLADRPPHAAKPRTPVTYKRPDGGVATYILWGLALVGLGVVVVFGARFLRAKVEAPAAAAARPAPGAPAAPPAPVHWKSVAGGDNVLITVEVAPRPRESAQLLLDGAPLPSNPVSLPRGSKHTITAMAEGFDATDLDITADTAKSVRLQLHRPGR